MNVLMKIVISLGILSMSFLIFEKDIFIVDKTNKSHILKLINSSTTNPNFEHANYLDCYNEPIKAWQSCFPTTNGSILKNLNLDQYNSQEREFLKEHLQEMIQRIDKLNQVCSQQEKPKNFILKPFLWDLDHTPNVLYCYIYKVASGYWTSGYILMKIRKYGIYRASRHSYPFTKKDTIFFNNETIELNWGHRTAFKLYPPPHDKDKAIEIFKTSLKFLVVRHPFIRLISGYRDQLERKKYSNTQLKNDVIIYHKQRNRSLALQPTSGFPVKNFPDFVDYLIFKGMNPDIVWEKENLATFVPQHIYCSVCASDYGLVVKLETMKRDEEFLSILANYEEIKEEIKLTKSHPRNSRVDQIGDETSEKLHRKYFSQLSRKQILNLYEVYKNDFDMFGYVLDEFLL